MLFPGNTGQPAMVGPPLEVGATVAVDVAVGLALGTLVTVVLVAVIVAEGVVVRVAVPVAVGGGELVEVRVGVVVATVAGVGVLVAVPVADAVAVWVGTCVGVGALVGVRVGVDVAVPRGFRSFVAPSERRGLNEMESTTRAVSQYLKRRFITISFERDLFADRSPANKRHALQHRCRARTFSVHRPCGGVVRRSVVGFL
jgi:hypothetical protein